jgi:sodium-dependent dicarboxylate transporter 2/3/5
MAEGLTASGLVSILSERMRVVAELPPVLAFLAVSTASVLVSAVASNTATTTLFMGLIAGIFPGPARVPMMASAAIAASCDFMLPAGTPPNAVVFGSGYVTVREMIRSGSVLDLFAAILAGLWGYFGVSALL